MNYRKIKIWFKRLIQEYREIYAETCGPRLNRTDKRRMESIKRKKNANRRTRFHKA